MFLLQYRLFILIFNIFINVFWLHSFPSLHFILFLLPLSLLRQNKTNNKNEKDKLQEIKFKQKTTKSNSFVLVNNPWVCGLPRSVTEYTQWHSIGRHWFPLSKLGSIAKRFLFRAGFRVHFPFSVLRSCLHQHFMCLLQWFLKIFTLILSAPV